MGQDILSVDNENPIYKSRYIRCYLKENVLQKIGTLTFVRCERFPPTYDAGLCEFYCICVSSVRTGIKWKIKAN